MSTEVCTYDCTPMHVQLQCQKGVLTEGGVFVDFITFEIDLNVLVFSYVYTSED